MLHFHSNVYATYVCVCVCVQMHYRIKWIVCVHQIHVNLSVNNPKTCVPRSNFIVCKMLFDKLKTKTYIHKLTGMSGEGCLFDTTMLHFVLRPPLHFVDTFQLIVHELIRDLKETKKKIHANIWIYWCKQSKVYWNNKVIQERWIKKKCWICVKIRRLINFKPSVWCK